jgi:HlyD family secretion protein
MQSFFSSLPNPSSGPGPVRLPASPPVPGPTIVPRPVDPKKPRRLAGFLLAAVVLVAGAAGWYWKSRAQQDTNAGGPVVTVPVIAAGFGNLQSTVRIAGTVAAERYASIMAPRMQGNRNNYNRGGQGQGPNGNFNDFNLTITKLVQPGSGVKPGDVVTEFDLTAQQQRLDDYKDFVVQTEANLGRLKANLAYFRESMAQQVRSSKADWDKAKLDLQTAPIRSKIDAEKYQIAVDEAKEAYDELKKQFDLQEVSQTAQIKATELDLQAARIQSDQSQANIEKMSMKSPINGIAVLQTLFRQGQMAQVRVGDQVNPGQTFLSIVDPSSMVVNASVNQVDAEKLRLGQKGRIRLDAYPDLELPGTVIGIGAMAKTSNIRASYVSEIPVRLKIDQAKVDSRIIPDLTASAEIIINSETDTVITPRAAVFDEGGKPVVFLQSPTGWVRRPIELGLMSNTSAAVRSGLRKGDVVALQRPL